METVLIVAAGLLALSAILHLSAPILYKPGKDTIGIALFGVIYAIISILVFFNQPAAIIFGVVFPAIGLIGALVTFKSSPVARGIKIIYILIDIAALPIFLTAALS